MKNKVLVNCAKKFMREEIKFNHQNETILHAFVSHKYRGQKNNIFACVATIYSLNEENELLKERRFFRVVLDEHLNEKIMESFNCDNAPEDVLKEVMEFSFALKKDKVEPCYRDMLKYEKFWHNPYAEKKNA